MPESIRGKSNVHISTLRGNTLDSWWSVAGEDDELDGIPIEFRRSNDSAPLRSHHEIRCGAKHCRNRVPAPEGALQLVFMMTTVAVREASKPGLRDWIYDLAAVVTVDRQRDTITYSLDGLRAALAYSNAKFARRAEQ
jgi:hypothetical protein